MRGHHPACAGVSQEAVNEADFASVGEMANCVQLLLLEGPATVEAHREKVLIPLSALLPPCSSPNVIA